VEERVPAAEEEAARTLAQAAALEHSEQEQKPPAAAEAAVVEEVFQLTSSSVLRLVIRGLNERASGRGSGSRGGHAVRDALSLGRILLQTPRGP